MANSLPSLQLQPLVIEIVLLTRDLTANQTLVLLDKDGRRLEIVPMRKPANVTEIVLERWSATCKTGNSASVAHELPIMYKKAIIVFRSLYTLTRLLPTWKLRKKLAKSSLTGHTLAIACRVRMPQDTVDRRAVALESPLSRDDTQGLKHIELNGLQTSVGLLKIAVDYRPNCEFRVDDSEALLSSHFMSSDQGHAGRQLASLPARVSSFRNPALQLETHVPASYSAQGYSTDSTQLSAQPTGPVIAPSKVDRRASASLIQPFKKPSLSASPSMERLSRSPREFKTSSHQDRTQALVLEASEPDTFASAASAATSRPALLTKRFPSSFGQRAGSFVNKRRISQTSDTPSPIPSPSQIARNDAQAAVKEYEAEDDDASAFLSLLESQEPLSGPLFRDEGIAASKFIHDSASSRTVADLVLYQKLRDSHLTLADSLMQQITEQSNRSDGVERPHTLAVGAVSPSAWTKASSPHAHTPSIPSRLSSYSTSNSIARSFDTDILSTNQSQRRTHQIINDASRTELITRASRHGSVGLSTSESPAGLYRLDSPSTSFGLRRTLLNDPSMLPSPNSELAAGSLSSGKPNEEIAESSKILPPRQPVSVDEDELFFAMSDLNLKT